MDKIVTENLFLLEFLVDRCMLLPCAVPCEICNVTGDTCVSFKFLDNDPLDVCEEDFSPKRNYSSDDAQMKSGKSCLFALSPTQAEECQETFDVDVLIFKKLTSETLPDKIQIGISTIPIVTLFQELIQLVQAAQVLEESGTVSRTLKDCYNILNAQEQTIGSVSVFIRMSCFGKLIVTQFQMNLEEKSVFFKDKEGKSLYKYRKASKAEMKGDGTDGSGGTRKCKPLRPVSFNQSGSSQQDPEDDGRCADCTQDVSPYGGGGGGGGYPDMYQQAGPRFPPEDPKSCYQEIGAEMNGNALTIRVHKNKGTAKRLDDGTSDTYMNDADKDACYCLNDKAGHGKGGPPPCYCLKTSGGGAGGGRGGNPACADKQVLNLRPGDDPNNPFAFKVSGCPNGGNNNVTVVSPTNTRPDGMQVTEFSDPNKDVFILRIGKKSEGTDKKANLELELVTPKGIERKPIPKKETRETQYLLSDAGPDGKGKKGKGKGKGKGGKKGKKGKKGSGDGEDGGDQGGEGGAGAGAAGGADAAAAAAAAAAAGGVGPNGERLSKSAPGAGQRPSQLNAAGRPGTKDKRGGGGGGGGGGMLMKQDRMPPKKDTDSGKCCIGPSSNTYCPGTCFPCPPCGPVPPCCCQCWTVPSGTDLKCSVGRIEKCMAACPYCCP